MSSRALRKIQREEERTQLQILEEQDKDGDDSEMEQKPTAKTLNAFDMLNAAGEDDEELELQEDSEDDGNPSANKTDTRTGTAIKGKAKPRKSKKKKKKNKKKGQDEKTIGAEGTKASQKGPQLDEIDLALKSLSVKSEAGPNLVQAPVRLIDPAHEQLNRLLAVESKHLNALNEMKRLFGNVVLENEDEGPNTPRRRGRGPQQLDLGGALAARNSPVARGQGLVGIALRRNFLMQGKEEWPKAAGGGLGMELVGKLDDGTIEYRFIHNTIYQDVQRQFVSCVESMDPQRMISMLVYNPYHVSTLLQVSEIAKQQGDHSVSGDLLERALFTFGRSAHSSFTNALSEGKARLNFDRPENREFFLAAWRFMNNLGQRGTWRTACEWAKLILSLDPELDPYCIHKVMDQLALRGGQPEHFLELSKCSSLWCNEDRWHRSPNVAISSALIENRLKNPQQCRSNLGKSIQDYPWIFARLFQELEIGHIPKSIWGSTPRTPREKLDCEAYVSMAKDLWNTPEATSLLVEVASYTVSSQSPPLDSRPVTLDEARHAVLLNIPAIIDCIPRSFTTQSTTSFDPFPPSENVSSYDPNPDAGFSRYQTGEGGALDLDNVDDLEDAPTPPNFDQLEGDPAPAEHNDVRNLQSFLTRFIPWLGRSEAATGENNESNAPGPSNEMEAAIAASAREAHDAGLPAAEIQERGNRLSEMLGLVNRYMGRGARDANAGEQLVETSERLAIQLARARTALDEGTAERAAGDEHATDDPVSDTSGPVAEASFQTTTSTRAQEVAENHNNSDIQRDQNAVLGDTADNQLQTPPSAPTPAHPHQPSVTSVPDSDTDSDSENDTNTATAPAEPPYDDERNQRWLAGQGMLRLKAYTAKYGIDPTHWPHSKGSHGDGDDEASGSGHDLLAEYVGRVLRLEREASRRFILDYALRQGAGKDVGDLVEGEVRRVKAGR